MPALLALTGVLLAAAAAVAPAPGGPVPPAQLEQPDGGAPLASPVQSPHRFGRFDLDQPFARLAQLPDLRPCAPLLSAPSGHADCLFARDADRLSRVQLAWDDSKPGGQLLALRLLFEPGQAPAIDELESGLVQRWGAPRLEELRRDKDQKFLKLQWEDGEHRATVEATGGAGTQASRAVVVILERRTAPLGGDLAGLRPKPFPGHRVRWVHRIDWEGVPHAVVLGTSLTPNQEAAGESGPAWATQRDYVGVWRLEPSTAPGRARRWKALWERSTGGEEDEEGQRILRVDTRDITGDGVPDVAVEIACASCAATANEVIIKTLRSGKLVDLLARRDLYRASVEMLPGQVRIREPEADAEEGATVSTYSYDRAKGTFVLAREERISGRDER